MRDNLSLVLAPELETSELECLADVLFEFCEELFTELFTYSHEMIVLHEMDILYWRRRTIFQNEKHCEYSGIFARTVLRVPA